MEYKGYKYNDIIRIVYSEEDKAKVPFGEVVIEPKNLQKAKDFISGYNVNRKVNVTEVSNQGFEVKPIRCNGVTRKSSGTNLWTCEVTHIETGIKFTTAIEVNSILGVLNNNTVKKGVIKGAIFAYRYGYPYIVTKNMQAYKDMLKEHKELIELKHSKTSKWKYGYIYETQLTRVLYLGKIKPMFSLEDSIVTTDRMRYISAVVENTQYKHIALSLNNNSYMRDKVDVTSASSILNSWLKIIDNGIRANTGIIGSVYAGNLYWTKDNVADNFLSSIHNCVPFNSYVYLDRTVSRHQSDKPIITDKTSDELLISIREKAIEKILEFIEENKIEQLSTSWLSVFYRVESEGSRALTINEHKLLDYIIKFCDNAMINTNTSGMVYDISYIKKLV